MDTKSLAARVDQILSQDEKHNAQHIIIDNDMQLVKKSQKALDGKLDLVLIELKGKNLLNRMDKIEEKVDYLSKVVSEIKDELLDNAHSVRNTTIRNTERIEELEKDKEKLKGRTSDLVWRIISYVAIAGVAWLLAGKIT